MKHSLPRLFVASTVSVGALLAAGSAHAADAQPTFGASTYDLVFNYVPIGATSAPKSVTVANKGTAPLSFSTISIIGVNRQDFAISASDCGVVVAPGGSCKVAVTFSPSAMGTRVGNLYMVESATCQHWIHLAGSASQVVTNGAQASASSSCDSDDVPVVVTTPGGTTPTATAPAAPTGPAGTPTGSTPTAPAAGTPTNTNPSTPSGGSVLGSTNKSACSSRRAVRLTLRRSKVSKTRKVTITVGKKRIATLRGNRTKATVNLSGLPRGRFALKIAVTTASGKTLNQTRKFVTCVQDKQG